MNTSIFDAAPGRGTKKLPGPRASTSTRTDKLNAQPDAIANLRRDLRATGAYFLLQEQHPSWRRKYLRTTSRLERFNSGRSQG
jgi:hypothetical protein